MPKKVYKTSIKYHCPFCDEKYPRMELIEHVEKEHSALIPENYTATRVVYEAINKTDHGTCMICKKNVYTWNEKISRYNNLCDNPKCREEVRRIALERHMRVYNKPTLLDDPMQQEKMLSNRHISGKYKYSDGTMFTYTGRYEKATIEFMDKVLNIDSKDIQMPGPVLDYDFNGETHSWITDIYYIPANLIIEVKDGGNNPNKREMPVYRGKQLAKEVMITNLGKFNYLRLTNNNFAQLLEALAEIKYENLDQKTATRVSYFINESGVIEEEATGRKVITRDKRRLFHISENPNIGSLEPRVPRNFLVDKGYEDSKTQRVCFASTIDGCLRAMSANIKGKTFYVYNPEEDQEVYIPTKEEVPDCRATGEVWVLNHVRLNRIGEIKVGEAKGRRGIQYTYGKNTAELYNWNWEWAEKYDSINESLRLELIHEEKSELDDDFKPKKRISLSSLKKIRITDSVIEKYKKEYPVLKHVRCRDTSEYKCDGYMWFDAQNELVCHVGSCEYLDDGTKWIVSLEVLPKFKGHDLSKQILDFATKNMNCKYLSVNKNNKVAKYIYDQYGFKTYQDDENMDYMTIDKKAQKQSVVETVSDYHQFKSPKEFSSWMKKNIKYKHTGIFLSPEEVEENKYGDCHDQAYFEVVKLRDMGYRTGRVFMVEYSNWNSNGGATHSICYYIDNGRYYWFENAWGDKAGIHGPYESLDDLKKDIANNWEWSGKNNKLFMSSVGKVKPGMSFEDYVVACTPEDEPKPFAEKGKKFDIQPVKEEVNAIPSMGRYSTFIIPYTVKNAFDIAIGNDKNNEVLIRGDDDTFKTVGLEKFEELYQPSQIIVYNEADACEKFEKMKSCKSISEALHILTDHSIKVYDELMLCENLKLRDFTSEDLGMEMIRRGVVRENEILSGAVKVYDTPTAIKPHVILSKTADGGCFIHTPRNYYLSSDIYPTPEDIPQNVIDTMEDLYVSNAGTEEME